jgi:hypothetical protein
MVRFPNHLICILDIKLLSIYASDTVGGFGLIAKTEDGSFKLYEGTRDFIDYALSDLLSLFKAVRLASKAGESIEPIITEYSKGRYL